MAGGLYAITKALAEAGLGVEAREWRRSVILEGRVDTWQQYITAGYAAAGKGYKGVVNDIQVEGIEPQPMYTPPLKSREIQGREFDAVIIGGGVIGSAVARELTRWNLTVAVLEKEDDLAKQTSSRNNGMIHPGISAAPGTKKLAYNIRGNNMYTQSAAELGFKLNRCGSVILLGKAWQPLLYPFARRMALKKGVNGIGLLSPKAVREREPNATLGHRGGLLLPSAGVVAPYKVTLAYGENAVENGAEIFLNTAVLGFEMDRNRISGVRTNQGIIQAKVVINAAGVGADKVAGLADDRFFSIHGRKGTIAILDKKTGATQNSALATLKLGAKAHTKGGGLNPTVEGNILMGPTAVEVPHREDWSTGPEDMEFLISRHLGLNTALRPGDVITYFSGIRACTFDEDFIIEPSEHVPNLVHAAGIQSPGLAAAPAIAQDVAAMAVTILEQVQEVRPNPAFNPIRRSTPELADLTLQERSQLIRENPAYGRILCRCEVISEGEVIECLKGPVPATSLDAVKRRVRAGMGRCQGGFCTPGLIETLARETGIDPVEVLKGRPGSEMLVRDTKVSADCRGEVETSVNT